MVRNCQLSDLIYLTALRVCVCARASLHVTVAGPFFSPCPLLSFVENAFDSLEASWLSEGGGDEELGWL